MRLEMIFKYDDMSWHYEGNFPNDLTSEAGGTHIGMFLAWMLLNGFASDELIEDCEDELMALKERQITGVQFLQLMLDEKMTSDDFNDEGNTFTIAYYQDLDDDSRYIDDYLLALETSLESFYYVDDSLHNYDKLAPLIEQRLKQWRLSNSPEYII